MASSLSAFATAAPAPTITPRLCTYQYAMYQASVSVSAAVMRVCRDGEIVIFLRREFFAPNM
jgi:hypothetical protein